MAVKRRKPAGWIKGLLLILGLLILRGIFSGHTTSNTLLSSTNTPVIPHRIQPLEAQTSKKVILVATNTPTLTPTLATALSTPHALTDIVVLQAANLRQGPGTNYAIVGSMTTGQPLEITAQNEDGSWYQLANQAWIASFLVSNVDKAFSIVDTSQIPTLPPTSQLVDNAHPIITPTFIPIPASIPTVSSPPGVRYGAICRDGTTSGATGRGACSHHGGVDHWLTY